MNKISAGDIIPILVPATNEKSSNFKTWQESIVTKATRDYGIAAQCLRTLKVAYPKKPTFSLPDAFLADKRARLAAGHTFTVEVTEWHKKKTAIDDKLPMIFAFVMGQCSQESKQAIESATVLKTDDQGCSILDEKGVPVMHNDWFCQDGSGVQDVCDPVRLMQRIMRTHASANTHIPELDLFRSLREYENTLQSPAETLLTFKHRFEDARDAYIQIGGIIELPQAQAIRFLSALDETRYFQFFAVLQNSVRDGVRKFPASVADAWSQAGDYVVSVKSSATVALEATAYVTVPQKSRTKQLPTDATSPVALAQSQSAAADRKKPTGPCPYCLGKTGKKFFHWFKDCRSHKSSTEGDEAEHVLLTFSRVALAHDGTVLTTHPVDESGSASAKISSTRQSQVLLDNQATVSVFSNPTLLTNIRTAPISARITGISRTGCEIVADQVGDFLEWKGVYYSPDASANVLSFSDRAAGNENLYDNEQDIFCAIFPNGKEYTFRNHDGLYVCEFSAVVHNIQARHLTNRELVRAQAARQLLADLAFPSESSLIDWLNAGSIINCPVTARDVLAANQVYGTPLASLRGKTTARASPSVKINHLPAFTTEPLALHTDVMFINACAYLLTVCEPIGLTLCNELGFTQGSRSISPIREAVTKQMSILASRGFTVSVFHTDPEGSLVALTPTLRQRGIEVSTSGTGGHVQVVERKIREVKERARGILNTLPFTLPLFLLPWLVFFAVSRINLLPHKGGPHKTSPFEAFNGRKVNYKTDMLSFGVLVEAHVPYPDNSMKPRTEAALSLGPTGNVQGTGIFYRFSTGTIIKRNHYEVRPMSSDFVDILNDMAASRGAVPGNLLFTAGSHEITNEDVDFDESISESNTNSEHNYNIEPKMQDILSQDQDLLEPISVNNSQKKIFLVIKHP
jgi:hypothetical protein